MTKLDTRRARPARDSATPLYDTFDGTPTILAKDLGTPGATFATRCECNGIWMKHRMTAGAWSAAASLVEGKPSSLYLRCTPEQHAYMKKFLKGYRELSPVPVVNGPQLVGGKRLPKLELSKYLTVADISEDEDTVVTIRGLAQETFKDDEKGEVKKYVMSTDEFDKLLPLNKTNLKNLVKALGTDETEEMIGKRVALFATQQDFGGQTYDVVRVRNKAPKKGAKLIKTDGDDDNTPF